MDLTALLLGLGGGVVGAIVTNTFTAITTVTARAREDRAGARPVVRAVADRLLDVKEVVDRSRKRSDADAPDFDEGFDEYWEGFAHTIARPLIEVPDKTLRSQLHTVVSLIDFSWSTWMFSEHRSREALVLDATEVGAELAGAYLRHHRPNPNTLERFRRLKQALVDWLAAQEEHLGVQAELDVDHRSRE